MSAKQRGETLGIVSVGGYDDETVRTVVASKETMAEMYARDRRASLLAKLADAQEAEVDRLWGLFTRPEL